MPRPRVTVAIGIPGSGKSTYGKKLLQEEKDQATCIVNPDTIRGYLYGYGKPGVKFDPTREKETWSSARAVVDGCIAFGKSVFIDATNPDRFGRSEIIKWFDGTGYDVEAARLVMEPGLAILRNKARG